MRSGRRAGGWAASVFVLCLWGAAAGEEGRVVEVRRGALRERIPATGVLRPRRSTQLGPQVSGRVAEVLVDVGQEVHEKDVLVRLDPDMFTIEVAQRRAELDAAQASLDEAEAEFQRMKALWEKPDGQEPSVPRKQFDDAKARRAGAAARHKQAEEALRLAEERLSETEIRAPYDAVVSRRLVHPGEPVTSAPIVYLLEVQDVKALHLEFSLPQELLGVVRKGTIVEFDVEGVGEGFEGEVDVVHPAIEEATRSFRSRVVVPNEQGRFRPGLFARLRVVVREVKNVLLVPRAALHADRGGWGVSVVGEGGDATRVVAVGRVTESEAEIVEGLREGERVRLPSGR